MGGKRARKGKLFFLYHSCIIAIFLLLTGCALTSDLRKTWQEQGHLKAADKFVAKGDYEKALKEYEAASRLFPKVTPGDIAVFNMGLIWVYPDNPKRDCKKSAMYFQQVIRDFPDSGLSKEARIWIYAIDELISCENRIKALEKSAACLKKKIKENQRMINAFEKSEESLKKKIKENQWMINAFEKSEESLKKKIEENQRMVDTLKKIDIGIEEKKREGLPR